MGGAPNGVGAALAQPSHQHVAGSGGNGQQRVIASLAGVAVVARALLGQTVCLADGGVQVDGQRPVAGSGPSRPGPGQQLPADPGQLADVAPPETAQERPQGGWRLDYAADGASRPAGAQHVGVVNAVATSQRGGHQGQHLVSRIRPPRRICEVNMVVDEFTQTQVPGQGGRKDQASIGHQAVVVEGDLNAVGVVAWQHLLSAPCFWLVSCSTNRFCTKNQAWSEFLCSFGPKSLRAWYLLVPAVVAVACAWSWLGKAASPIHVAGICSVRVSPAVMEFTASFIAVRALVTASRSLLGRVYIQVSHSLSDNRIVDHHAYTEAQTQ